MSLRIGVDLDGTLADLSAVYHEYESSLFGRPTEGHVEETDDAEEQPTDKEKLKAARKKSRQQEEVWRALKTTPNLWMRLKPIEATAVADLYAATLEQNWEVFFITQRPQTAGWSVQKQSQDWLMANGFKTPSVLTLAGSRGKAARALDLDFLIDDLPKNCIDAISDSRCRPILILREPDSKAESSAKRMNIGIVRSIAEAIELLKQPSKTSRMTMVSNVLRKLGVGR